MALAFKHKQMTIKYRVIQLKKLANYYIKQYCYTGFKNYLNDIIRFSQSFHERRPITGTTTD